MVRRQTSLLDTRYPQACPLVRRTTLFSTRLAFMRLLCVLAHSDIG